MEATTGAWDMYGVDDPKRYAPIQDTFFKQAGDVISKRDALRGFVALCKSSRLV